MAEVAIERKLKYANRALRKLPWSEERSKKIELINELLEILEAAKEEWLEEQSKKRWWEI